MLTDEQEVLIEQCLEMERELLYRGWLDTEDICLPILKKKHLLSNKDVVSMKLSEWEGYTGAVKELLQVLAYARERIERLDKKEPATIPFEEYIKKEVLDYDAENFEKVRDRFEEICINSDSEELGL